ncbi:PREDICTED: uncharacterized protein LOC106787191 isoform X1 [Polistes canadensis]|uniref:uncharacterized protein LOC106787191 isoform X1 n=1 Tax=Polistes canadensis TaxID=91411 RepID=UPI000718E13F|nr:PREDICTED: uncharacterized protein LOC106787191 isoform X1 [Polistes canadensis]
MISYKKCCAACPGVIDIPKSKRTHECCLPKYVSGNLKISSIKNTMIDYSKNRQNHNIELNEDYQELPQNYNRFAMAKKLHAENLKHQPLPDKINDDVMKNFKLKKSFHLPLLNEQCKNSRCKSNGCNKIESKYYCDSILGYKKPETKMDLAICWQTPVDPIYDPPKPTHIDGSEGGAAPAIFELIQGVPKLRRDYLRSHDDSKYHEIYQRNLLKKDKDKLLHNNLQENQNNCQHRCKCTNFMNTQKSTLRERSRSQYSVRNDAIYENKKENDPRLIKSAVGIALGMESNNKRLLQKVDVPRPKTPFAKRSFSIETLSPPFSVVNGSRDTDYPEHWRLMTVYQQSYKNPRKYKSFFHC